MESSFWCDPDATKLNETMNRLNHKTIYEESSHELTEGEEYPKNDKHAYIPSYYIFDKVKEEAKKSAHETLEKWKLKLDIITPIKKKIDIKMAKNQLASQKGLLKKLQKLQAAEKKV